VGPAKAKLGSDAMKGWDIIGLDFASWLDMEETLGAPVAAMEMESSPGGGVRHSSEVAGEVESECVGVGGEEVGEG
jgi:hypothetical protein